MGCVLYDEENWETPKAETDLDKTLLPPEDRWWYGLRQIFRRLIKQCWVGLLP